MRTRLADDGPADLAAVGRRLGSFGVTGVTDCTPTPTADYFDTLAEAVRTGALPLTVAVTGAPALSDLPPPPPLRRGPVKIVITDHLLPSFDDLVAWFTHVAHGSGRPVAVHCVTRAALLLALAVWEEAGSLTGDRIEHASVTPPDAIAAMARLSLTVVTQPTFVAARGDAYLRDVEQADRPDLYRCASFLEGGVAVGGAPMRRSGPTIRGSPCGPPSSASRRAATGSGRIGGWNAPPPWRSSWAPWSNRAGPPVALRPAHRRICACSTSHSMWPLRRRRAGTWR